MIKNDKKQIGITLTPKTQNNLEYISDSLGLTKSQVIAYLINTFAQNNKEEKVYNVKA